MTQDQLTVADIAQLAGVSKITIHTYRSRGTFPPPDGHLGPTPWWTPQTVAEWMGSRRKPGRPKNT